MEWNKPLKMRTSIKISAWAFLLLLYMILFIQFTHPIIIAYYLLTGWVNYIHPVFPNMHLRPAPIISALVYCLILLIGGHYFLKWLYREMQSANSDKKIWRWRWSINCLLVVLLMFTSGIAAVGVTHQTMWMLTSPEANFSFPHRGRAAAYRIKCSNNLKQIGAALELYAQRDQNALPDDFATLMADPETDLSFAVFVCPNAKDDPPVGATTQARLAEFQKPNHCSYGYVGTGLHLPLKPDQVVAFDLLSHRVENKPAQLNILFGDWHVEAIDVEQAAPLLKIVGYQIDQNQNVVKQPTTKLTRPTTNP